MSLRGAIATKQSKKGLLRSARNDKSEGTPMTDERKAEKVTRSCRTVLPRHSIKTDTAGQTIHKQQCCKRTRNRDTLPHAGLIYSGSVAGEVYSAIEFPKTFVLIGPNHTGIGAKVSMMASGEWEIPTGVFSIDEKL